MSESLPQVAEEFINANHNITDKVKTSMEDRFGWYVLYNTSTFHMFDDKVQKRLSTSGHFMRSVGMMSPPYVLECSDAQIRTLCTTTTDREKISEWGLEPHSHLAIR